MACHQTHGFIDSRDRTVMEVRPRFFHVSQRRDLEDLPVAFIPGDFETALVRRDISFNEPELLECATSHRRTVVARDTTGVHEQPQAAALRVIE